MANACNNENPFFSFIEKEDEYVVLKDIYFTLLNPYVNDNLFCFTAVFITLCLNWQDNKMFFYFQFSVFFPAGVQRRPIQPISKPVFDYSP